MSTPTTPAGRSESDVGARCPGRAADLWMGSAASNDPEELASLHWVHADDRMAVGFEAFAGFGRVVLADGASYLEPEPGARAMGRGERAEKVPHRL